MARLLIALGSNLADPVAALALGWQCVLHELDLGRARLSRVYRTRPEEGVVGDDFANAVGVGYTNRPPMEVLDVLLGIEAAFGRDRPYEGPQRCRSLDLDLLDHAGARLDEPGLQLPHPRLGHREFVLQPLLEIAPAFIDMRSGATAGELLARLRAGLGEEQ